MRYNGAPSRAEGRFLAASQLAQLLPDLSTTRPVYRHLADAIRTLVLDGRIALHIKLPAERELAPCLKLSRATVTAAYDLLRESGYARSRRGSGTWTALPDGNRPAAVNRMLTSESAAIDLTIAAFGLSVDVVTEALDRSTVLLAQHAGTTGYHLFGLQELRTAVADRYTLRGLPTRPEQIFITSGAQQALMFLFWALCRPGGSVMVENPTYPNALEAIRRARLRTVPVPVSDDGWDDEVMQATLRQVAPRLAYLIPDFHNPTGCLMPVDQRVRLLRAARVSGTWLAIDETFTDTALDVPTPGPFASHAGPGEADHIISIGSMSKSHWGGLRIGWLRATPQLIEELAGLRVTVDTAGSVLDQLVAVALLERDDVLLPARIAQIRQQRSALMTALATHAPQWTTRWPPGGLSAWVDLGQPVATALAQRAIGHGVHIESGTRFSPDPGTFEHRLRIPYTLPPVQLDEAVRRLVEALHGGVPLVAAVKRPRWVA